MRLFYGQVLPQVEIYPEEQQHLVKVLRIKQGEEVFVTDGNGNLAKGLVLFEGKKVRIDVLEIRTELSNFPLKIHLAIAPTKNIDRIEFFTEKATELGISEITFLSTEKTERRNLNFERLVKQSIAASKQSLRFHFPKLNPLTTLSEFISTCDPSSTYVAHCDPSFSRLELKELPVEESQTFLIGPEGDFSPNEIENLIQKGVRAVSLGPQRLRTETAGVFLAAWNYSKFF
ncbi:RsmE family RNA methyltransferase [Chryseobacterium sp. A301]